MKVSKFRIAVLVLLAVTVVYAVMFALSLWRYSQIPTEGYDPILGHWYGNPKHFFVTSEGQQFFMAGVGIALMWIALIAAHSNPQKRERKKEANGGSVGGVSPPSPN